MYKRLIMLLLTVTLFVASTSTTYADDRGTGVYVNGYELNSAQVEAIESLIGYLPPGSYWLDDYGFYWIDGFGNFYPWVPLYGMYSQPYIPSQSSIPEYPGYIDRGPGGTYGTDGDCYYFSWPDASYMAPSCD